ncbi:MAG: zf-HC2 domain-containing protein, partial [Acidobacteriales bacterium]|nr:zf-HC2 domain-containing protein [Terriglobales bacterium]
MADDIKNSGKKLECSEFDALLADAIDGVLSAPQMASFSDHAASCPDCGPLFAQAKSGFDWL